MVLENQYENRVGQDGEIMGSRPIRISGESFGIQLFGNISDPNRGFDQIWNQDCYLYYQGFQWNIRGKLRNPVFGSIFKKGFNQMCNRVLNFIVRVFSGILGAPEHKIPFEE